jgi:hypothetical protein
MLASAGSLQGPSGGGGPQGDGRSQAAGGGSGMGLPGQMGGGSGGQRGQGQNTPDLAQKLSKYVLPSKAIGDSDLPGIKTTIDGACKEINASIKAAGQKVDYEVIKSGILDFQSWLKRQGCVRQASTRYDIESTEKYTDQIFFTYPGTLAFDIDFKMAGNTKKPYRLLLFVTKADLFKVASLVENSTIDGIPVPKDWPNNTWSYWNERESYWKKHP